MAPGIAVNPPTRPPRNPAAPSDRNPFTCSKTRVRGRSSMYAEYSARNSPEAGADEHRLGMRQSMECERNAEQPADDEGCTRAPLDVLPQGGQARSLDEEAAHHHRGGTASAGGNTSEQEAPAAPRRQKPMKPETRAPERFQAPRQSSMNRPPSDSPVSTLHTDPRRIGPFSRHHVSDARRQSASSRMFALRMTAA